MSRLARLRRTIRSLKRLSVSQPLPQNDALQSVVVHGLREERSENLPEAGFPERAPA